MNTTAIGKLWESKNESLWKKCLDRYWDFVEVNLKQNYELEREMNALSPQDLEPLDSEGWYNFLKEKYFRWKYTDSRRYASTTKELRRYIEKNRLDELFSIKQRLLALDVSDIKIGLKTTRAIHGLGTAGASGLLSLLYPGAFGTVDQFVVKALLYIPDIPEKAILERMNPSSEISLTNGVFLIKLMRKKAGELNKTFETNFWTPRKIDMILWITRD